MQKLLLTLMFPSRSLCLSFFSPSAEILMILFQKLLPSPSMEYYKEENLCVHYLKGCHDPIREEERTKLYMHTHLYSKDICHR